MNLSISTALEVLRKKIEGWFIGLSASLPNLIVAILVIFAFWLLSKVIKKIVSQILHRFTHNGPVSNLMGGIIQTCIFIAGIFIALGILNLDKTVTSLLAGAGVVGLAIGFAFQEIASNFIAGVLIAFRKPFKIGDIVKINDHEGKISDIDLRTTRLATYDGLEVIIPNKDMFTNTVTNYTATPERRVDLEVGVSYGEDLRLVRTLVLEALVKVTSRLESKDPEVFFTSFADSSINFKARVWITHSDPITYLNSLNDMVISIKEIFDQNDVTIPFPIRTLDFGIKGGEKLSDIISEMRIEEKSNIAMSSGPKQGTK